MSVQIYTGNRGAALSFSGVMTSSVDFSLQLQVQNPLGAPYYDPAAVWHVVSQTVWPEGESRAIGGLTFGSNGKITGTPLEYGKWVIEVYAVVPYQGGYVTTDEKRVSVLIAFAPTPPVIESGLAWTARVGIFGNWRAKWADATGVPNFGSFSGWSAQGLPLGLEIDALTGIITGAPDQSGEFSIQLTVVGPAGSDTKSIPFSVLPGLPKIVEENIEGVAGVSLEKTISVEQSVAVDSWALAGAPVGMSISAGGVLTWANPVAGDFAVTVSATGSGGSDSAIINFSILEGGPKIIEGQHFDFAAGDEVVQQIAHSGSGVWSIVGGALPQGIFLQENGVLSGAALAIGDYSFTAKLLSPLGESEALVALSVSIGSVKIVRDQVFYAPPGGVFEFDIQVQNPEIAPVQSWTAEGLPEWAALSPSGKISGNAPEIYDVLSIKLNAVGQVGQDSAWATIIVDWDKDLLPKITSAMLLDVYEGDLLEYAIQGSAGSSFGASNLPGGWQFNAGVISVTPVIGSYSLYITAENSYGRISRTLFVNVWGKVAPLIQASADISGLVDRDLDYQVIVSGVAREFTATGLPLGLSINSQTGLVSGVPTSDGIYNATIFCQNEYGQSSSEVKFTITFAIPQITSSLTAIIKSGVPFFYRIEALYATSYEVGSLPSGLVFSNGVISGTPGFIWQSFINISAISATGRDDESLNLEVIPVIRVTSPLTATALTRQSFSYQITGQADMGPIKWFEAYWGMALWDEIDEGNATISFDETTGLITGSITNPGTYSIWLYVYDDDYNEAYAKLTLTVQFIPVIRITSPLTANAVIGQSFSYQIAGQSDAGAIKSFNMDLGLAGLDLDEVLSFNSTTGLITGSFTDPFFIGTHSIGIYIQDEDDNEVWADLILTVATNKPEITSSGQVTSVVGQPFEYVITASNSPTSYSAANLPEGFVLDSSGKITATPLVAGLYVVDLSATNEYGSGTKQLSISISSPSPSITSSGVASAVVGQNFNYQIIASNSPSSYSASGLPEGLSLDSQSGLISGLPSVGGVYSVSISATSASGTGSAQLTITIVDQKPVITSSASATGTVGVLFNYQITASNSPTGYGALGLPDGLNLDSATGLISGTLPMAGFSEITVSATNQYGAGSLNVTITIVDQKPVITSSASATGTVGVLFNYQITASNSPTGYGALGLPDGLNLDSATGLISGTLPLAGFSEITVSATNQQGTGSLNVTITFIIGIPQITSPDLISASIGVFLSYQIVATNSPTSYSASALPPWLTLADGVLSGMPVGAGNYAFTVFANNSTGQAYKNISLSVLKRNPVNGVMFGGNNSPLEVRQIGVWERAIDEGAVKALYGAGRGLVHPRVFYNSYRKTLLKGVGASTATEWGINSKSALGLAATEVGAGAGYSVALVGIQENTRPLIAWGGSPATSSGVSPVSEIIDARAVLSYLSVGNSGGMIVRSDGFMVAFGDAFRNNTVWGQVISASSGYDHYLSVDRRGKVNAWGSDSYGQLNVPANLIACSVCAGREFSLALKTDGSVVAWGRNNYGQVASAPQSGVKILSSGYDHVLAIKFDGSVVAWGLNDRGQTNVPVGLDDVIGVAAGDGFSVALRSDGSAFFWGQKAGLSQALFTGKFFQKITAGKDHLLAIDQDGYVITFNGPALPAASGVRPLTALDISYDDIVANDWVAVGGQTPAASGFSGALMKCGIQDGAYYGIKARPGTKVVHLNKLVLPGGLVSGGVIVDEFCKALQVEFSSKGSGCLGIKFYSSAESAERFSLTSAEWDDVEWDFIAHESAAQSIEILGPYAFYAVKGDEVKLFLMVL